MIKAEFGIAGTPGDARPALLDCGLLAICSQWKLFLIHEIPIRLHTVLIVCRRFFTIHINKINPRNASLVEMTALESYMGVDKNGGLTSLPPETGMMGLSDRTDFMDMFQKQISDMRSFRIFDVEGQPCPVTARVQHIIRFHIDNRRMWLCTCHIIHLRRKTLSCRILLCPWMASQGNPWKRI